jgi:hypothetical protein
MARVNASAVKLFERPDGGARTTIYIRDDGLYDFEIEERRLVEGEEFPYNPSHSYWAPTSSGLYETFEEARDAAVSETPWLKSSA